MVHTAILLAALLMLASIAIALGGWVVLAVDRGVPARFGRRDLAVAVREGGVRLLLLGLGPLGWSTAPMPARGTAVPGSKPGTAVPGSKPGTGRQVPVVLVPDHGRSRSSLWFLELYLSRHGFPSVYATSDPRGDLGIAERAAELGRHIEAVLGSTGAEQIDLVAHSLGGLVAAWYVRHLDGAKHVRRLVTLGTPWAGTKTAVFTGGRIGPEMLHGNALLASLVPPPVPTVAVWSPDDPVVVPSESACPVGADSVRIDGIGHLDMLTSALVYRAVQAALARSG